MLVLIDKNEQNVEACINIAKDLSDFFNEDGIKKICQDLKKHDVYMAFEADKVIGFASVDKKSEFISEISWMAVDKQVHRNGTGSEIMGCISRDLKDKGIRLLEVKTLSHIEEYEPYEKTRAFYRKNGFVLIETINPYPEWGEGNPCDIYVKIL